MSPRARDARHHAGMCKLAADWRCMDRQTAYREAQAESAITAALWRAEAIRALNVDLSRADGRAEQPGYFGRQIRAAEDSIVRIANSLIHAEGATP